MKKLITESGCFDIRKCKAREIEHTSPDYNEIPVIATAQSGEWVYMLLQRNQIEALLK